MFTYSLLSVAHPVRWKAFSKQSETWYVAATMVTKYNTDEMFAGLAIVKPSERSFYLSVGWEPYLMLTLKLFDFGCIAHRKNEAGGFAVTLFSPNDSQRSQPLALDVARYQGQKARIVKVVFCYTRMRRSNRARTTTLT